MGSEIRKLSIKMVGKIQITYCRLFYPIIKLLVSIEKNFQFYLTQFAMFKNKTTKWGLQICPAYPS